MSADWCRQVVRVVLPMNRRHAGDLSIVTPRTIQEHEARMRREISMVGTLHDVADGLLADTDYHWRRAACGMLDVMHLQRDGLGRARLFAGAAACFDGLEDFDE